MSKTQKPLSGLKVVELGTLIAGPFCTRIMAEFGAEVIKVESPDGGDPLRKWRKLYEGTSLWWYVQARNKKSVTANLKHPAGREFVRKLIAEADILVENFRPGVLEKLGLGWEVLHELNPKLVMVRLSGFGQSGPMKDQPGFGAVGESMGGLRYITGFEDRPPVRTGISIGDSIAALWGVIGALMALRHREVNGGQGQVVDTAMVDGAAALMSMFWAFKQIGMFDENAPGTNLLDTGAHFYDVFECADGKYVSLGSIEPQFYAELMRLTGLAGDAEFAQQMDKSRWVHLKERLAEVMLTKTRDEWCVLMEHTDVCFAPVLTMSEAAAHPHNVARGTFVEVAGATQPAPAPRFSRTAAHIDSPPAHPGQHSREVLADWGFSGERIESLVAGGAVASS